MTADPTTHHSTIRTNIVSINPDSVASRPFGKPFLGPVVFQLLIVLTSSRTRCRLLGALCFRVTVMRALRRYSISSCLIGAAYISSMFPPSLEVECLAMLCATRWRLSLAYSCRRGPSCINGFGWSHLKNGHDPPEVLTQLAYLISLVHNDRI